MHPYPSRSNDKAQALLVELTRLLLTDSTPEDVEPRPETELHHTEIHIGHERKAEMLTERFAASDYRGALDLFSPDRRGQAALLLMNGLTDDELADLVSEDGPVATS